ncbi:HD-GYP domain-containing protein [Desulfovirgula thermocuniculi]|uniref:HD-GYP domain-containing protein n=1 Tax=Desulfovirgula thermocuniculi TaxID=348842 RepID=UPI001B7FAE62|nr:HD domain-containing phosphohydrolase [Desulfovirgula thermocuniculi]
MQVDLTRMLVNLSLALDFSRRGLLRHHQRVAVIALRLGEAAGLSARERFDLFAASMIHDAGAVTWPEKDALEVFDVSHPWEHCHRGYQFTADVPLLAPAAEVILSHHDRWEGGNPSGRAGAAIPLASRIIHLADRVDVLLDDRRHVLSQSEEIVRQVKELSGSVFDPELVDLFAGLAEAESFWLDITGPCLAENLLKMVEGYRVILEPAQLMGLACFFARIIDAKSPFTRHHSQGVARAASFLAARLGMTQGECFLMEVAGLLHDLGKLSVPEEILEKPGRLTREEFSWIKQHTYYTYWLLKPLDEVLPVVRWAAYHHEKLNGKGYPFRLRERDLCLGARIMAVSDIYAALREDRPYRRGLAWPEIEKILRGEVEGGALDRRVVEALLDSRRELDDIFYAVTAGCPATSRSNRP